MGRYFHKIRVYRIVNHVIFVPHPEQNFAPGWSGFPQPLQNFFAGAGSDAARGCGDDATASGGSCGGFSAAGAVPVFEAFASLK